MEGSENECLLKSRLKCIIRIGIKYIIRIGNNSKDQIAVINLEKIKKLLAEQHKSR